MARGTHVPVLLERCLELLAPRARPGPAPPVHVDATLGLGGHAEAVLAAHPAGHPRRARPRPAGAGASPAQRLAPLRRPDAPRARRLRRAARGARRARHRARSTGCCSTSASPRCSSTRPTAASPTPRTRRWTCGWTRRRGITAEDVVNTYSAGDLARVLRVYGEEKFAGRIAAAIVRERAKAADHLLGAAGRAGPRRDPGAARRTGGHPAKRTFQALRIEVNGELDALERGAAGGARRARAGRPDRGAVLPLAGGPARQAGARRAGRGHRRRSTCRSSCPAPGRRCGCSPGAPSCRARPRWRPTRGPRRCGCGRRNGSIPTRSSYADRAAPGQGIAPTRRANGGSDRGRRTADAAAAESPRGRRAHQGRGDMTGQKRAPRSGGRTTGAGSAPGSGAHASTSASAGERAPRRGRGEFPTQGTAALRPRSGPTAPAAAPRRGCGSRRRRRSPGRARRSSR